MENPARTPESSAAGSQAKTGLVLQARALSSQHILRLAWKPDAPGSPSAAFAISIASYLFGICREVVESRDGELLDDLDFDELVTALRSGQAGTLTFRTGRADLAGEWRLDLTAPESGSKPCCHLVLMVCNNERSWVEVEWLQASFDYLSPMRFLVCPEVRAGSQPRCSTALSYWRRASGRSMWPSCSAMKPPNRS
jgi:hypothetical protein